MKKFALITMMLIAARGVAAQELTYEKAVIREDTTWSGTVNLVGQSVVKAGVTLTILPGTVVKFPWIDEDNDGIGDGELTVEGKLLALGTRERPILFTSGREKPAAKDWSFIMVSVSRETRLAYCVVEYAFTGVQVHYSTTAEIRDCTFRNNWEGMRFSTTNVVIEHSDFSDNYYGLRYESHGSAARVEQNRFSGNTYSFFPAQRSSSTARITGNNVERSVKYAVNVGEPQRDDLDYSGNWWGSDKPEEIRDLFYDKTRDPILGRIIWEPFLTAPVPGAGVR